MSSPFAADPSAVRGAITPLITPFTADGALDLDAIPRLVDWQLERGTHGISVGGSTGEPTSQTVAERIAVMRAAAAAIDGRVPFLPGTGTRADGRDARADRRGAAARRRARRSSSRPTTRAPSRTGCSAGTRASPPSSPTCRSSSTTSRSAPRVDIAPATVGRLRRAHDNIVGIKETTRDFEHVSYVLNEAGSDFIALSGIELLCYPMLALGRPRPPQLRGRTSRPRPVAELYDAFAAGDHERRPRLHYDLHRSSTRPSPRPTRCRPSGSCKSWGLIELRHGPRTTRAVERRRPGAGARAASGEPARRAAGRDQLVARPRVAVLAPPGAEALDRGELVAPRRLLDPARPCATRQQVDQFSVLGDRLRAPVGDVDEHRAADRVQPPPRVVEHLDQGRVRATGVDDLVKLAGCGERTPTRPCPHWPSTIRSVVSRSRSRSCSPR